MTSREFRYHKRKKLKSESWEDVWGKAIADYIDQQILEALINYAASGFSGSMDDYYPV